MKRNVLHIIIACLCVAALSGCATENVKEALQNLKECKRHYAGAIGGTLGQTTATFDITCEPQSQPNQPAQ